MRNEPNQPVGARQDNAAALQRSPGEIEQIVVMERLHRYNNGLPCGAVALHRQLRERDGVQPLPSVRQIAQVLIWYGLTHGRTGWYDGEESACLPASARVPITERR